MTPFGSNPGSTWLSAQRLRTRRPVPIKRTRASATSSATKADRSRSHMPDAPAPGDPAFNGTDRSAVGGRTAGATPTATVTSRQIRAVKPNIRASIAISLTRGNPPGAAARSRPIAQNANSRPITPPASTSTADSVNRSRATRPRPAPNAARIASSRERVAARTRDMLATLAHARSSTVATAAERRMRIGRTAPNCSSCSYSETNSTWVHPRLSVGYAAASRV